MKRYKTRDVLKVFMQIPGVDYSEYYSPVAKDSTIRIILSLCLIHDDCICHMVDVEAAFLNPTLTKSIFIKWPEGAVEHGSITEEERKITCI